MSLPALVALAGNPNTGKTSVFNRLTGASAKVGNYAGVTVDRESGRWKLRSGSVEVVDIPGAYSLSASSQEEQIAVRALLGHDGRRPRVVVVVVDSTQLARNLYFVAQLIEAGLPLVVALNLVDVARAEGRAPDPERIARALGVPAVAVSARTGEGMTELGRAVEQVLAQPERGQGTVRFTYPAQLEADLAQLVPHLSAQSPQEARALSLWALLSLTQDDELIGVGPSLRAEVARVRGAAEAAGRDVDAEVVATRWAWLDGLELAPKPTARRTLTQRVDRWVLHPVAGSLLFITAMAALFQALFTWSEPAIHGTEQLFEWLGNGLRGLLGPGLLGDLVVDGVVAGVGSVLVFLPQILLLFFLLGLLEDSGYLPRVAFLVDRGMRALGLHGRAFVPMLSGYACAVPAVMATRALERRRDRLVTMLALPLMTCSARLPVYTLVIAAMLPAKERLWGVVPMQVAAMVFMYLFSTAMALLAAAVIGRTVLKGPSVPLLLELPPYRLPRLATVARQMWLRAKSFLTAAGRIIFVCTIVMWALMYFPRPEHTPSAPTTAATSDATTSSNEQLRNSYGGRLGRAIEPAIAPLGFDWKIGIGLVGAFAAREVFVSTLGVVYGLGHDKDEESGLLRDRVREERRADGTPRYTPLVGLSLMVFFALCAQCMSTLAVVRKESGSWRWPVFLFVYMTALAWLASFAVYQGGRLLGFA